MAFTYDTSTDIGKVRFEIGDTTYGAGVKPSGANLTDAEIQLLLTREGTFGCAAAAACEILARHWSHIPDSASMKERSRANNQVMHFRDAAKDLRAQYGGIATSSIVDLLRDDAYHTYNPFQDDSGNEYGDSRTIYIRP